MEKLFVFIANVVAYTIISFVWLGEFTIKSVLSILLIPCLIISAILIPIINLIPGLKCDSLPRWCQQWFDYCCQWHYWRSVRWIKDIYGFK